MNMKFDHKQKDFFAALGVEKESSDFIKKTVEESLNSKSTVSETIVEIIEKIREKSLGITHDITEFEMFLLVSGFLLGTAKAQKSSIMGTGEIPDEIGKGLKKALLKHLNDEDNIEDKSLKISIQSGKNDSESFAVFSGRTDVDTGMEVNSLLRKIQKEKNS